VRRGKLPATRLGRMALITSEDLREWRPMRERAPRKYRRREPNPEATPALLDLASAERVELASRLASLYEALYAAASGMPRDEFFDLLADRLAGNLGLRRVVIRITGADNGRTVRVGSYGPPLSTLPDEISIDQLPMDFELTKAQVVQDAGGRGDSGRALVNVTSLLVAPIRIGDRELGIIAGDLNGERFQLNEGELDMAQAVANVAAIALAGSRIPQTAGV
jgi:GAF domain-containing protein